MRSRLRSQSKKKLKENDKVTAKKEKVKRKSQRKSSNKKDDDQNTKTIVSASSITKKQQQKQKSQAKKQKSYQKKKQQSRSISHKRKIPPQLSCSKQKKKQQSNKRQQTSNKFEKSKQHEDIMMDIEDIIRKQLEMQDKQQKRMKNMQSIRSKPSNQEIVKTIFFPKKHKNIEGKSTHEELIIQGIMRVDRDLKKRKQKNRNKNMKNLNRKVSMKVERLKDEVDKEILNGAIVPWLLPEWGLQKASENKSKDIREWMREGLGFDCVQESSESEKNQQKHQPNINPVDESPSNKPQHQNIYYERAILIQNFHQYYNTGMKFLNEHLPKRQITLQEFQSYEDFVQSNFTIIYYLSRFYYKNFDKTKKYFTDSAQFDKYYTQDLMDCFQYIFPEVKQIVENQWRQKFQQGWDEYDENVGVRAYEQRKLGKLRKDRSRMKQSREDEEQYIEGQQDMITYKDWLQIFKKAFKPANKQEDNNKINEQQQLQLSPPRSSQKLQVEQEDQIQMIESNNFVTQSISKHSHQFESPVSKGMKKMQFMKEHQKQNQLQDSEDDDLDEYYLQISTIIKSKRKEDYNSNSHNTSSVQRSATRFGAQYEQQQSMKKQSAVKQNESQMMLIKPKKHKQRKSNKRLNKSMIELRQKINLDSDSDTEQDIQGIDEAFLLEDESSES